MNTSDIREHMMVHIQGSGEMQGSGGIHVGTVDRIEGNSIKLTRNDSADGQHHYIPLSWVERTDNQTVYLNCSLEQLKEQGIIHHSQSGGSAATPEHTQNTNLDSSYSTSQTDEEAMDQTVQNHQKTLDQETK